MQASIRSGTVGKRQAADHTGTNAAKAQGVADKIKQAGGSAVAVPGDMLDAKHIDELIKKAAEFGSGKIHIIVNNAGFTWDGVIHKVSNS